MNGVPTAIVLSLHVFFFCVRLFALPRCSWLRRFAPGVSALAVALASYTLLFVHAAADNFIADTHNHRVQHCFGDYPGSVHNGGW